MDESLINLDTLSKFGTIYVNNKDDRHCIVEQNTTVGLVMLKHRLGADNMVKATPSEFPYAFIVIDTTLDLPELAVYRKMREAMDITGWCKACGTDVSLVSAYEDESGVYCEDCAIAGGKYEYPPRDAFGS